MDGPLDLGRLQLENMTPQRIAAALADDPRDKALLFLRVNAIRQRQEWEAAHREPFAGVFLRPTPQ